MKFGALAAVAALATLVAATPAAADRNNPINAYRVAATAENLRSLAEAGFDVTEGRRGDKIEVYGTATQLRKLRRSEGVKAKLVRDRRGRTSAARSARAARRGKLRARSADHSPLTGSDAAYKVWRRYDRVAGDGKEQYLELYDRLHANKSIAERVVLEEKSHLGRDFVAVKLTKNAKTTPDDSRPAVLYNSLQHSREWLAGETCRRSLVYFADNYGIDPRVTRLVDTRELWFYCVANPDGYEYSFTAGNRLWRKNMADNDGDGHFGEVNDGVDPNRNFPVSWGLDDEGSSPDPASETYRGPGPASEPETKAMLELYDRVDFEFQKNDHTAASLILYPQGWQQYTPAADDPIFTALAGDDHDPAINGFDPDLGAELYITNGDTLDTAYNERGILAYTPEGTPARDLSVSGFEYADSEGSVQEEFVKHRAFTIDLAESADDPSNPDSHLKNTVEDFYVDAFPESWGGEQPVQVLAKRSLGALTMRYRIAGGPVQEVATTEWSDGERYYQEAGEYYHRMRGTVTGAAPGQQVEVWFKDADSAKRSQSFTYTRVAGGGDVLLLAAEDYSGPTPALNPNGPHYADEYTAAITANGYTADLYDVDARGRRAPHPLGVLSHYRDGAVVWYTGDDYLTREPGQVPGTGTSRLALEEMLAVRDYINEGGKLVYAGKHAAQQYVEGFEFRNFGFPQPNESNQGKWCNADQDESRDGCILHNDDFLQYYLGAYLRVDNGGSWQADGTIHPITGLNPLNGSWTFANTPGDAGAGAPTSTLAVTSSLIDNPTYQDSQALAAWNRPGSGPFSPHHGDWYVAAGHDDEAYKRMYTSVAVEPGTRLKFWASHDLEPNWDFMFVEVRDAQGNWTTLPDANGNTTQETGDSCWEDGGWQELHPRLLNYQTVGRGDCTPTGTTGEWHAATASSGGWQEWDIDLGTAYSGQTVEVAIVVATDWAFGNLGAWVDEARIEGSSNPSSTSFEDGMGVWQFGGAPAETPNQAATWIRTQQQFEEGAVIGTTDTVYAGFDVSTIATPGERASFMSEALKHLGLTP